MLSATATGMIPIRDSARASAASTSSIAWTQARSDTVANITSVLEPGPNSESDGKEDRLPFALQPDVEVQHAPAIRRDQRLPSGRLDEVQNRIGRVGIRLVRKVQPGHQMAKQAPGENGDIEVGRLHPSVWRGYRAGLGGPKAERAFGVGSSASESRSRLPDLQ